MIAIRKFKDEKGRIPFDDWLNELSDHRAKAKILVRLKRLAQGNEGDRKPVGEGVKELRISEGKGYRVYYTWDGQEIVVLLAGGDKSTQDKDIETAKKYRRQYYA